VLEGGEVRDSPRQRIGARGLFAAAGPRAYFA